MLIIDPFELGREEFRKGRPAPAKPRPDDDLDSAPAQRFYGYMLEKAWQEVKDECARIILQRQNRQ